MSRWILLLAFVFVAGSAFGQQAYTYWTVEAMTVQSRSIFQGEVVDVNKPQDALNTNQQVSITVRVGKVIKGKVGKTAVFTGNLFDNRLERFNRWKQSHAEILWFDFGSTELEPVEPHPHLTGLIVPPQKFESWDSICLSPPQYESEKLKPFEECLPQGFLNMDMQACKSGNDVLNRVNRFIEAHQTPTLLVEFLVPPSLPQLIKSDFGSDRLVIPIVPELERILWRVVTNPGSALQKNHAKPEEAYMRQACVRCLCYFRSDQNIGRLKALLKDPEKGAGLQVPFTAENEEFWVRAAARDVLAFWGVAYRATDKV